LSAGQNGAAQLHTVYDWVTVGLFAGLIVLFLQRSSQQDPPDHLWQYLIAAVGCALTNYLGNEDMHIPAIAVILATLAYIHHVLRPFRAGGSS